MCKSHTHKGVEQVLVHIHIPDPIVSKLCNPVATKRISCDVHDGVHKFFFVLLSASGGIHSLCRDTIHIKDFAKDSIR